MNKQNDERKRRIGKNKWTLNKKQLIYYGVGCTALLLVLAGIASLAVAQLTVYNLGPNEMLEMICEGRGIQVERVSRTQLRLTCREDNQQPPPAQPTETAVPPGNTPAPQPTQAPPPTPMPTVVATATQPPVDSPAAEIGKWGRYEVAYGNPSWEGNPFDLAFSGVFTHVATGRTVTQLGFYAGNNTWKIFFMPDELGEWTFVTQSPDPELHGHTGLINCVPSELPGRLTGDGNRWRLQDSGEYLSPIMLPSREWLKRTNTSDGIDDFIVWADETAGATIVGTTLVYFSHAQSEVPYIKGQEGETFNVEMWDRLNSHYDMLRDRGMGFYIMFYSDDGESPNRFGITEQSEAELRLFRYAIARFSAYPIVMWDTGIDISETRSNGWIDWFAEWFNANDPWRHPVSSRTGGGSGGKFPASGTYYSDGAAELPNSGNMLNIWVGRSVPTAYTDRWREDGGRGGFNRDSIRQAAWQAGLTGGAAIYVTGNENGGYLTENYANDFQAAPDLGHRTNFFQNHVSDYGSLWPHGELVVAGSSAVLAANPGQQYVVYVASDSTVTIDLQQVSGEAVARIYHPLTGQWVSEQIVGGGGNVTFDRPAGMADWVIHITR